MRPSSFPAATRLTRSRRALTLVGAALLAVTAACGSDTAPPAATSAATSAASAATSSAAAGAGSSTPASAGSSTVATPGSSAAGSSSAASSGAGGTVDAATATSAADFGGMEGLVAAAEAEGKLNVIALPPDWANYAEIIALFESTYPAIALTSQQPNISSAEEISAAESNKGTDTAPDVFDLSQAVTNENVDKFAPYKVMNFDNIPDEYKDPEGRWVNDYTGLMSVGYNATKFGEISSLEELADPKFAAAVALNGNPTQAGAAFNGVVMAALANEGTVDDIAPGVEYFKRLREAGTLAPVDPTPATILSGQTGVVFDWSYNAVAVTEQLAAEDVEWRTFVPEGAAVGSYYVQAINADAPNPAAARLWQEFLYTPEAQNLWIKGGARPVLYDYMRAEGLIDPAVEANLPPADGLVQLTTEQTEKAGAYLKENWANAVGG